MNSGCFGKNLKMSYFLSGNGFDGEYIQLTQKI